MILKEYQNLQRNVASPWPTLGHALRESRERIYQRFHRICGNGIAMFPVNDEYLTEREVFIWQLGEAREPFLSGNSAIWVYAIDQSLISSRAKRVGSYLIGICSN